MVAVPASKNAVSRLRRDAMVPHTNYPVPSLLGSEHVESRARARDPVGRETLHHRAHSEMNVIHVPPLTSITTASVGHVMHLTDCDDRPAERHNRR